MCRSIKTLHNFTPPATDDEIRASSLQFVRKLSGFTRPSRPTSSRSLAPWTRWRMPHESYSTLVTKAPLRDRDDEASKARARAAVRYRS